MYFPYLRGRQFELIALRELVTVLSPKIVPIIEPVKVSATLISTIKCFDANKKQLAIIVNPQVGDFDSAILEEKNGSIKVKFSEMVTSANITNAFILEKNSEALLRKMIDDGIGVDSIMAICKNKDSISVYEKMFADTKPRYCLTPDEIGFRKKIKINRVLLADKFNKQSRNSDYANNIDEPFSEDHLDYIEDNCIGFSDFSIVGDEYIESGFAPYAVAIHIVYFDEADGLRLRHFVSDTNDDISDPAKKFAEAVEKLCIWNRKMQLNTIGIKTLEKTYQEQSYPGLGTVKKLSIMHHLELMNQYLTGVSPK